MKGNVSGAQQREAIGTSCLRWQEHIPPWSHTTHGSKWPQDLGFGDELENPRARAAPDSVGKAEEAAREQCHKVPDGSDRVDPLPWGTAPMDTVLEAVRKHFCAPTYDQPQKVMAII